MVTIHPDTNPTSDISKLMNNRVVLITGASRGIGAATAKLFARHGAAIGVNYYSSEAAAQQVVDEIISSGGKALAVKADVREPQQVETMVQQVVDKFGTIDTLIANANAAFFVSLFVDTPGKILKPSCLERSKRHFFPVEQLFHR